MGRPRDLYERPASLFVAALRRLEPQLDARSQGAAIEAICRRVGGLPLALELAAHGAHVAGVEAIANRVAQGGGRGLDVVDEVGRGAVGTGVDVGVPLRAAVVHRLPRAVDDAARHPGQPVGVASDVTEDVAAGPPLAQRGGRGVVEASRGVEEAVGVGVDEGEEVGGARVHGATLPPPAVQPPTGR